LRVVDLVVVDEVVVSVLLGVLGEPGVAMPEEADPVVSDELPAEPLLLGDVVVEPLELGDVVEDPLVLLEGAGVVVVDRVVVEVVVSRPSVRSRSEHAPSARVASAAATATPIARVFNCFIVAPI
jgi:hypothetical protein